jgi:flagellin
MGNITGGTNGSSAGISASTGTALAHNSSFVSQGAQQVSGALTAGQQGAGLTFGTLTYSSAGAVNEVQTLTFSINDSTGTPQTASVTLNGANAAGGATNLTAALAVGEINAALQANGNAAVRSIVAVLDQPGTKISFASAAGSAFNVSFGPAATSTTIVANGFGGGLPNTISQSTSVGTGASADISTQSGAQSAVSALANAVTALGSAQAVVGRGQNQFSYAINLAQSQLTNLSTAESRIRDADLASEAANLTKAQILLQAGVAALAQANAAPQAVLSLLKG